MVFNTSTAADTAAFLQLAEDIHRTAGRAVSLYLFKDINALSARPSIRDTPFKTALRGALQHTVADYRLRVAIGEPKLCLSCPRPVRDLGHAGVVVISMPDVTPTAETARGLSTAICRRCAAVPGLCAGIGEIYEAIWGVRVLDVIEYQREKP